MPSEARVCTYRVLRRVFEQDAYADRALHSCAEGLAPRERALAMRLSYGAIQRIGTLDPAIERLSGRSIAKLDPAVLAALRLGLYELLYSGAPAEHAIVDDAVELAKRARSRGHGLVNAVLRRAAREGQEVLGPLDEMTPQGAAVAHSHPAWLAEMWWQQLGPDRACSLMRADNEPAEHALRVNTLRADTDRVAAALQERAGATLLRTDLPEAIVLAKPLDLRASELWREGAVIAQSRAAMLVSHLLDPQPGESVLDLCAAPGGKTTHIAALMHGQGRILACERHPGRARQLRETVERLGAGNVEVQIADASVPRPPGESFDRVLVDAPCSGLGTLQGHPDLRWRASEQKIRGLADLQCKILGAAAEAVRAGGTLIYATCTISITENERQIEAFLNSHAEFELQSALPAASGPGGGDFLITLPDRDRTAGFFVAKLKRR
ncbi:MAG TPA: 16S rRNA (cytosine(967)-C(5))-methyltransferase RsmB [Solirubrobacteraceae bacterium]|jgi:16S rRNA (cytosine967-C5)-methyltransferase|nr:16S rRNA (cytosine(967)-C(5))-methyltransferase RsmB [Solirubrobacteraceae bacterium]